MTDKIIRCKKCKKKLFYLPKEYEMNLSVNCVDCHDGKKTTKTHTYSKMKKGKRVDIHPTYSFRSATEMNFARILNHLGLKWRYEERVFTFPDRKVRPFMYIMDFEVTKGNDIIPAGFYEIKGRMKPSDRQKLRLLKKYYPEEFEETQIVIYSKYKKKDIQFANKQGYKYLLYDQLTATYKDKIPNWE